MSIFKTVVKRLIITFLFILLIYICYYFWWNLPVTINRYSDIKFGNQIIENIEIYKRLHGLPKSNDWKTLKELGFNVKGDFFIPDYEKINDTTYELTFLESFEGPYLHWNSTNKKWKNGMPTIKDKTRDMVLNLIEQQKVVKEQSKLIDSLSFGKRHITLLPLLEDTVRNIFLIKVGENNGQNLVIYFNFLVDANQMKILNPSGKIEDK